MSEMNGRRVLKAQLHDTAHVDGLGNTPNTLTANLGGKVDSCSLTYVDGGVLVRGTGPTKQRFEFLVPAAMCKIIQFVNE